MDQISVADFNCGRVISASRLGEVIEAVDRYTGQHVAIRIVYKERVELLSLMEQVNREKSIISSVQHPICLFARNTFQDVHRLFFVIDLCSPETFQQVLGAHSRLSLRATTFYIAELVQALDFLHSIKVAHRRVYPRHLLLSGQRHLRVSGFLYSERLEAGEKLPGITGDVAYAPPEAVEGKGVDRTGDLWQLGATAYRMLIGRDAFSGSNELETLDGILVAAKTTGVLVPRGLDAHSKHLLGSLMREDPRERLGCSSAGGFKRLREHSFFAAIDFATLGSTSAPPLEQQPEMTQETPAYPGLRATRLLHPVDDGRTRQAQLLAQSRSRFAAFLLPNELILKAGILKKNRRGKDCGLVLTDYPRLLLVSLQKDVTVEIPWTPKLQVKVKSESQMVIVSEHQTLSLFDPDNQQARVWEKMIASQLALFY